MEKRFGARGGISGTLRRSDVFIHTNSVGMD